MSHHSARSFVAGRTWACLLLSLLVCGAPSLGYAEETIVPTKEVHDVLRQAVQAAGEVSNPVFRAIIIDAIASAYVEMGNPEQALELAGRKDNFNKNETLLVTAKMLVEQGHSKQAADIASRIGDGYWKASVLEELGRYHGSKGEKEAAIQRFNQALKAAESIDDSSSRVHTMLRIAEAQAAGAIELRQGKPCSRSWNFHLEFKMHSQETWRSVMSLKDRPDWETCLVPCRLLTVSRMVTKRKEV